MTAQAEPAPPEIEAIFRKLFKHYAGPVHRALTAPDVPGWDSLTHVDLIMMIEDLHGIEVEMDRAFEFENLGQLLDYAAERKAAR